MTPPVFRHGELRLLLLTLIAQRPQHGYELIQGLSDHFGGAYSPSAGTIYPRLAKLESEGLVTKRTEGRKTVYAITPEGQREVDARADEVAQITSESTEALSSQASIAREGLTQARADLRAELDRIANELREAALAGAAAETESERDPDTNAETTARPASPSASDAADAPAEPAAGTAHNSGTSDEAADPAQLLRRIDEALQRFRMQVRQDARLAARHDELTADAVADLARELSDGARRFAAKLNIFRER